MPFTVNVGPYRGGEMWQQGLLQAGQNISEGIMKAVAENKKIEEEQAADQVILNYGKSIGLVTPEIEAQYMKGGHSAKTGIVGGLLRQFTMQQQQAQEERMKQQQQAMEADRQARLALAQQAETRQQAEATWTPPPEAIAKADESDTPYLPVGPGRYALRSPRSADQTDTIDVPDPTTGEIHKISTRSRLGQAYLEKNNPARALLENTGLDPEELFNSDITAAGNLDPNTHKFTKADPETATHIRIGDTIMEKEKFKYYQNRLNKAGQNPYAKSAPGKGSGGPAVGTTRTINGVPAVWDGKGWKPAG